MIYIFEIVGTNYIKLGYTKNQNVYYRIQNGFWTNKHPIELCGKLSPVNLKLYCVFEGDLYIESIMKIMYPPYYGEFYKKEYLKILTNLIGYLTIKGPVFQRPNDDFFALTFEKLLCCGGKTYICNICDREFQREHKLYEHKREVHEKKNRIVCECGKEMVFRNLKRHKTTNCSLR